MTVSRQRPASLKELDYSILQQCMHCGMCLPSCPTYRSTKKERHSPRGRIALMRAVADDHLAMGEELQKEMDYCLGCLACTSACPAGVDYGEMFEVARAESESTRQSSSLRHLTRQLTFRGLFLHPRMLGLAGRVLRFYQRSGLAGLARWLGLPRILGRRMAELEKQTPKMEKNFSEELIAEHEAPPEGVPCRGRVILLSGCIQSLAFSRVNRATADVLLANGWEVMTPRHQGCCGSIHAHNGEPEMAWEAAEKLMAQMPLEEVDAVISNAGGCGSHLKHYGSLLVENDLGKEQARAFAAKVKDIHEFLVETGFRSPKKLIERSITYHPSCHLHHVQGVVSQPLTILKAIPGLEVSPLPNAGICCGSAGIYNILQPEESRRLGAEKCRDICGTGAEAVATANPGCHLQIQNHLDESGEAVEVTQPVLLLAEAYRLEF
ncbi:MAG: (Fe-S)-binding protein [Akkermansiaceae bacterium]